MLYGFIGISVVLLFIFGMLLHARRKNVRKEEELRVFAKELGLSYQQEKKLLYVKPFIKGALDNRLIELFENVKGSGKSKKVETVVRFNNSPIQVEFQIGKETFISRIGKIFGYRDIEFQNLAFDKKFLLKADNEAEFRTLITHDVQDELMRIQPQFKGAMHSEAGVLSYTTQGEMNRQQNLEEIRSMIPFMLLLQNKVKS